MMTPQNRNLSIGMVAIAVLVGTVLWASANRAAPVQHTYYGIFSTVQGLKIGAPVYLFGVQVGNVQHMQLINGQVQVSIRVDSALHIPIDSSLEVQTAGLFAEKSMTVLLGFEADALADKAEFMYTGNAVDVMGLLNQQLDRNIEKRGAENL